jgi:hypothetical protein
MLGRQQIDMLTATAALQQAPHAYAEPAKWRTSFAGVATSGFTGMCGAWRISGDAGATDKCFCKVLKKSRQVLARKKFWPKVFVLPCVLKQKQANFITLFCCDDIDPSASQNLLARRPRYRPTQ